MRLRWVIGGIVCVALVVLGGLFLLRNVLRSDDCGGGFACSASYAVEAEAFNKCRSRRLSVLAREFGTAVDPHAVARAVAWRDKQSAGDLSVYWGCLEGLGVSRSDVGKWEPPGWRPPD